MRLQSLLDEKLEQGKVQGELAMLVKLYDAGTISLADAVKNSNMSEEEFLAFAKKETKNT